MAAPPRLSLVIPVYDEEANIPLLAGEIRAALEPLGATYEVVWVDDGSRDGSPAALHALATADPRHRVLRMRRNSGQSAALGAGFAAARGDVVVTLDADLQNDPADIPRLLAELDGCDVVCGVRAQRHDSWVRRISSRIANGVRNRVTREHVTDVGCTLRAIRAPFARRVPIFTGIHRFLPTLLRLDGARIKEIPVNHRPRRHGVAKYGIGNRLWRGLVDLAAVRWMQSRWVDRHAVDEIAAGGPEARP